MNILITGIHGFVGSNLVVALKESHTLYGLDIITPEKEGVTKTFSWKDIETISFPMQNLPKFDAIIHLAGRRMIRRISLPLRYILISILD